jgi:hypothetical protein
MSESVREIYTRVGVRKGWFYREVEPGDDLASPYIKTRERDNGSRVDELFFNQIEGHIQDLFITRAEFSGKVVHFMHLRLLMSDGKRRNIRIDLFHSVAQGILNRIENIDFEQPFMICVAAKEDRSFSWVLQNGAKVPSKYSRAHPGDKPEWRKVEIDGETKYDKSEQRKWWMTKVEQLSSQIKLLKVT